MTFTAQGNEMRSNPSSRERTSNHEISYITPLSLIQRDIPQPSHLRRFMAISFSPQDDSIFNLLGLPPVSTGTSIDILPVARARSFFYAETRIITFQDSTKDTKISMSEAIDTVDIVLGQQSAYHRKNSESFHNIYIPAEHRMRPGAQRLRLPNVSGVILFVLEPMDYELRSSLSYELERCCHFFTVRVSQEYCKENGALPN